MFSFLKSLSLWDWADVAGLLMVFFGVVGEICAHKRGNDFWESLWGYVLIVGLGFELIALPHHFIEAGELKKAANDAAVKAGELSKQVEALRQRNLELSLKMQPRKLSDAAQAELIGCLKNALKGPVTIQAGFADGEAMDLANQLISIFTASGFETQWYSKSNFIPFTMHPAGLWMTVREDTPIPSQANAIAICLSKSELPIQLIHPGAIQCATGTVHIFVGPRF